ncbi:MAG: hypothetical protein NTZ02_03470 [Candidatus Woesearchaeota archaeon]|nr:hypothetical protein [Candidatus Woesearchaeota archaeon]
MARNKKADMAINAAFILVVAIVAVIMFLLIIFAKFPAISKSIDCKTLSPLKTMFSPSSGSAEESYCRQNEILQNSTIKMETLVQRQFYSGSEIEKIEMPPESISEAKILLPKTNISSASFEISGYSPSAESRFADGSESQTLDFSEVKEQEVYIKLPKVAYVTNATMDFFSNQPEETAEVLVFTGYSNPSCGSQFGNGMEDDVREYLTYHSISYDETKGWKGDSEWEEKLKTHSILIVGCGFNLTTKNEEEKEAIKSWIGGGNTLLATGWAINLLVDLFGNNTAGTPPIYGETPYFTRITPYQKCPGLATSSTGADSGSIGKPVSPGETGSGDYGCTQVDFNKPCSKPDIISCQETVGWGGFCGESQRINFTADAQAEYGVKAGKPISVVYSSSPCFQSNISNRNVRVLADLVYNESLPLDNDVRVKCADRTSGNPGQSIIEFRYGNGSVIYLSERIEDQMGTELGETNFFISIIISKLRKSSSLSISSCSSESPDWQSSGSFKRGRTAKLNPDKINSCLRQCIPDDSGNCTIPIKIKANLNPNEPILILSAPKIEYELPISGINVSVGGKQLAYFQNLSPYDSPKLINEMLKNEISQQLLKCSSNSCTAAINISSTGRGIIILSGLNIEYKQCVIAKEIVARVVACWERAGFGKSGSDINCYELSIPENCTSVENVNESSITEIMINESDLCDLLGNNDANPACGRYNQIEWNLARAIPGRNILIEYSAKQGKIIIS